MQSFLERNRKSRRLVTDQIDGLILVAPEDLSREFADKRASGVVRFSAPGYSDDGHALLYGSYFCGALCGYGWLFLLERTGESWRVVATEMLWIS